MNQGPLEEFLRKFKVGKYRGILKDAVIHLKKSRLHMCRYEEHHQVESLAVHGPCSQCKLGPVTWSLTMRNPAAVIGVLPDAAKKWESIESAF